MRKIVQKELSLKIPVLVYVVAERRAGGIGRRLDLAGRRPARDGARRRTSARRRRSRATATNIGSDLRRKVVNDAAASLRGLAKSPRPQRRLGRRGRPPCVEPDGRRRRCGMNVIDVIAPTLPALLQQDRRPHDRPAPPHAAHRRRADRRRAPGLLHALPVDADRPEHRLAALPRGPRRARVRALPSRASSSREPSARSAWCARCSASRCCRCRGAGLILVLLGAALLVARPARDEPRRADAVRARRDGARARHALPQGACAVPHVRLAARRRHRARSAASGRSRSRRRSPCGGSLWRSARSRSSACEGVVRDGGHVFVRGELWRAQSRRPARRRASGSASTPRRPDARRA